MLGSSSSNAVSPPPTKHDVFLSFRGEDTRHGFTGYLYEALCKKNIETYIDDRLCRGEEISPALHKAIEESSIYVVILSEHYASSRWCLDELTKILECNERYGREVIPIFYNVHPSNIRHQRGSYEDPFVKHEERSKDKVQRWKAALTKAAGISGWELKKFRYEHLLVKEIVQDILRKLNRCSSFDYQGLVGIHKHIEQIQCMLHGESPAVRIIGIWGIGGTGKTTIASALYHKLAAQFDSNSFVGNVQEKIERHGILHVPIQYLLELLGAEGRQPENSLLLRSLKERIKGVKVLLVLDDVNNLSQVNDLIGGRDSFGLGSRIILTSRDMQVLKNAEADEIYAVKEMDFQDSLQLFSLNAFKQKHPLENYMDLSLQVLNYAKGIPLALKVLGSLLYGRTKEEWRSELQKLERLPHLETYNVLKLSYDGLDDEQKDIFLDIACFYRGLDMNTVKQTLDDCGFSAAIGIRVLLDKGLISVLKGQIVMHDLIQEMGQEIVRQQCVNDPGRRSRLWKHEDIYDVLRKNRGTDAVQCIFLDMCQIKEVHLHCETFKTMSYMRMLQFYKTKESEDSKVCVPAILVSLPDELRFLRWDGFPYTSLPPNFCPENLVKLDMRDSRLKQLWEKDQHLPNLKRLDLSGSRNLFQIPDLSQCPNIEEIILSHCISLVQVKSSAFLHKLSCLWLFGCVGLRSISTPSNILSRSSGLIVLYNCCNLEMFSVSNVTMGVMLHSCSRRISFTSNFRYASRKDVKYCIWETPKYVFEQDSDTFDPVESDPVESADLYIKSQCLLNLEWQNSSMSRRDSPSFFHSPSFFPSLSELCWLDLSYCESLTSLPIDLCKLKFLRRLTLQGCSNLEKLPEINETLDNLMVLILDESGIQELPFSMYHLVGLEELSLHRCQSLELIPSSIGSLSKLCKLDLTYCESLETLPSSIFKLKLTKLDLHGCSMLRTFPEILEPAESFAHICLTKTGIRELPSSFEYLVGLQILRLNSCKDLECLPNSIGNVNLLTVVDFSGCEKLSKVPSHIGRLSSLRELSLHESGIVNLPESIALLSSLRSLDLSDCKKLECIPELPPFLKHLLAFDCPSIKKVSSSGFEFSSGSKEDIFKIHLTNCKELDPSAHSNIVADAWHRILCDEYKSVFFCFPGSAVPHWFTYRCKGHSVTLSTESLNLSNDNKLVGLALSVVFGLEGMDGEEYKYSAFSYRFRFESDDGIHTIPTHDQLRYYFNWKGRQRFLIHDHTFVWKYYLDSSSISSNAYNFTFEIFDCFTFPSLPNCSPTSKIKECGISPLNANEKDDTAGDGDSSKLSKGKAAHFIAREQKKRRKQDLC